MTLSASQEPARSCGASKNTLIPGNCKGNVVDILGTSNHGTVRYAGSRFNIIVSKLKLLSLSFLSALRHRDDGGVFFIDIIRASAHEGLPPYSH